LVGAAVCKMVALLSRVLVAKRNVQDETICRPDACGHNNRRKFLLQPAKLVLSDAGAGALRPPRGAYSAPAQWRETRSSSRNVCAWSSAGEPSRRDRIFSEEGNLQQGEPSRRETFRRGNLPGGRRLPVRRENGPGGELFQSGGKDFQVENSFTVDHSAAGAHGMNVVGLPPAG
jgi:hypothetical protein